MLRILIPYSLRYVFLFTGTLYHLITIKWELNWSLLEPHAFDLVYRNLCDKIKLFPISQDGWHLFEEGDYLVILSLDWPLIWGKHLIEILRYMSFRILSLGYYCNRKLPEVLVSSGRSIYVRFHSDGKEAGKGFQIQFRAHKQSKKI